MDLRVRLTKYIGQWASINLFLGYTILQIPPGFSPVPKAAVLGGSTEVCNLFIIVLVKFLGNNNWKNKEY